MPSKKSGKSKSKTSAAAGAMVSQAAQSELVRNAVPQWFRMDPDQVPNNAGGFVWEISDKEQVARYLVIGSEGGNFYQTPQQVSSKCASCVLRMTRTPANFKWLCDTIRQVSMEGRAAKQEPTLLSLATAIVFAPTQEAKRQALAIVPDCVRILTHMYMLTGYIKLFSKAGHPNLSAAGVRPNSVTTVTTVTGSGFGRGFRRVVQEYFYTRKGGEIANLVTKYQNREGWTVKDILTLVHIDPKKMQDAGGRLTIDWVFKDKEEFAEILKAAAEPSPATTLFKALQEINQLANKSIITSSEVSRAVQLIKSAGLCREHIPTQFLKKREIWEALLTSKGVNGKGKGMPLTALIRNLGKLTTAEIGIIGTTSTFAASCALNRSNYYRVQTPKRTEQGYPPQHSCYYTEMIFHRLTDQEEIRSAKIHPYNILVAMLTYKKGTGDKGSLTWSPNLYILEALDFAFKLAFQNITPTGKQITLALDVSGSMSGAFCTGSPIVNCATGSVAMMMMTLWVENQERYRMMGVVQPEHTTATATAAATQQQQQQQEKKSNVVAPAVTAAAAAAIAEAAKWKITKMPDGRTLYEHSESKKCQFEKPEALLAPALAPATNAASASASASASAAPYQHSQSAVGGRDPQRDPQRNPQHKKVNVNDYRKTKQYLGIPQTPADTVGRTQQFGYTSSYTQPDHYLPELYPAPAIPSNVKICAFSNTYIDLTNAIVGYMDASIDPNTGLPTMTIEDALKLVEMPFSSTDCALPMVRALGKREEVDAFVVYTDSETYMGTIHPQAALEQYRSEMRKPDTKLIVVGMTSNCLTIADPKDLNTLNLAGFDTATPRLISDFIAIGSLVPTTTTPPQRTQLTSSSAQAAGGAAVDGAESEEDEYVVIDE
jgi:60 kDa SS-A/Ro ribonucleoprotein